MSTIAPISQAPPIILSSVVDTPVLRPPISEMVSGASIMGTSGISVTIGIVSDLGLEGASALILGSGVVLHVQYAQCSHPTTVPLVPKSSYVQVIHASPNLTKNSGCDSSLHAVESSKSPNDDHLEAYYEEDKEEDGNES